MPTAKETLVVVEDDDDLRRLLEHVLVFDGYQVITAAHGAEALQILNRVTPSLVVLDLVLPWTNGVEVLASMRSTERLRSVPVVVITGTATSLRELQHLMPLTVLHKPLNAEALTPVIQQMLSVQ
ncbi:MAG TPA: response regulator [Vicinamibacterales bacterium]